MSALAKHAFANLYHEFLASCGVPDPGRYYQSMADAYCEPHRAYHNNTHITFMLDKLAGDTEGGNIEFDEWEKRCIMFAVWWHDYVYDPQSKDNELQSIAAWENFAERVLEESPANNLQSYKSPVSLLINCTISHTVPSPASTISLSAALISYFLDLDLAILSAPRETYEAYANNIRREYIRYSIEDYRKGRIAVLKGFLGREKIFLMSGVEGMANKMEALEEQARENIQWEISELETNKLPLK